tara:strand:- start:16340 stop:19348 length:3009 start_codon:yes stop_codon:yes gene_type:complete
MAQNDIIDIDAILDEYEAGLLGQAASSQAQQQAAADLDLQKLGQFGYQEPSAPGFNQSPFSSVAPFMEDRRSKQQAIEAGIKADDPYFIEKYLPTADPQIRAEYTGVDFTGGAAGDIIRQISFLPSDVGSDPNYIQKVVQKNYATDHGISPTYDYNVRVEPNTNELIFNDPLNENQPTVINPPGIDKGDLLAFAEPLVAEIGAGIAGGVTAGVVTAGNPLAVGAGAMTAETLATYVWRLQNLDWLDSQGYLPEDYDINMRAMKDAGMTALFSIGGVGLFKLAKMAFGVANPGKSFLLDEDEFIESYNTVAKEVGEDVSAMTAPQVMLRASEEGVPITSPVEGVEAGLRQEAGRASEYGQPLREKYLAQEQASREAVEDPFTSQNITQDLVEEETGAYARSVRGEQIRAIAEESLETSPDIVNAEKAITDLNLQSDQIFNDLIEGAMDPATAGSNIRSTFQQAKDAATERVDAAYDEAATSAGFKGNIKPYDYSKLVKPVKKISNIVREQAFGDPREAKRLEGVLKSITSGNKKRHATFVKDLSELRTIIREQSAKGGNVDDLVELRDTMLAIRKDALKNSKGGEAALAKFEKAEVDFRQLNEDYKNKVVRNMLKIQQVSADKYQQGDKQAYEGLVNFFRSNITERADGTLDSPEYINKILLDPENTNGLLGLKAGLKHEFMNKVLTDQGGVLKPRSPNAFSEFMKRNGTLIKKFFTEEELAQFDSAEAFARTFKENEVALTKLIDKTRNSKNLSVVADNIRKPELIFNDTWKPKEITATRELFDAVTTFGNRELIDSYKSYIYKDFMEKTQNKGSLGQNVFDARKMEKYLEDHGDAMEVWFGRDFTSKLGNITKRLKSFDDLNFKNLNPEDHFVLNSINSLARAYVGLFTTPGRILTAVKGIYGGAASNRQMKLLSDPDKLYEAIMSNKWQKNPVVRGAVRELGRLYYREEVDQPILKSETTPMESIMFGPDEQKAQFRPTLNRGGHVVRNLGVPLKYGFGE